MDVDTQGIAFGRPSALQVMATTNSVWPAVLATPVLAAPEGVIDPLRATSTASTHPGSA